MQVMQADDDDLYSGYNEYHPSLDTAAVLEDEAFQQAVRTSYGKRPIPTAKVPGTSRLATGFSGAGFQGRTAMPSSSGLSTNSQENLVRPMTAVRGAGFTSTGHRAQPGVFDPMNQAHSAVSPLLTKEDSPEERLKKLEKKVSDLLEESCFAAASNEMRLALDKAKEAASKERALTRQREQLNIEITPNMDLTFSVLLNLACRYADNEMYTEAINTYQIIIKNRSFSNASRLKVNIGNIYFTQGNYPKAIKFYRMALDQVPATSRDMKIKIMKNVGLAFVKLSQYTDAITSYEYIMSEKPDFRTALQLILCHHALGDKEKMKRSFLKLLDITLDHVDDEDKYSSTSSEDPQTNLIVEAIKNDSLRKIERKRKQESEWTILTAAKIIAPVIATTFAAGYEWCVEQIKTSPYSDLANDLEMNKAVTYLRKREFDQAIETLKLFEKKETKVASTAATNLSFLYYFQGDLAQAEKCAEQAIITDRYNAGALVNKGNCCVSNGDYEKAVEFYKEALVNEASCVEALYNIGLTYKKMSNADDALEYFYKLHAIVRNHPQIIYQIANLYEMLEDTDQALEWYQQVVTLVPTDPYLLAKIGDMFEIDGDKQQAFQYYSDSYRYFPSNMEIIQKLGAYYVDSQMFEKAIKYFERASVIQPNQIKWQLMVAMCHRRSGNYQQALYEYKAIHRKFPDNTECLKFLVRLCADLGLQEASEYAVKLKKAEKAREIKNQRVLSSGSRPGSRRSSSRTSRDGSASSLSTTLSPRQAYSGNPQNSGKSLSSADRILEVEEPSPKVLDLTDMSGFLNDRPKTSVGNRDVEDEFDNEELGDDLLPD